MTLARYDIGFSALKGPDYLGDPIDLAPPSAGGVEVNSLFLPGASLCTYGASARLPNPERRRPGDQHVAFYEAAYHEFVAVGELAGYFADSFDRGDSTSINTEVTRWQQRPQGIDDAWYIIRNAARARGEYRMLGHPFGPYASTYVETVIGSATNGTPGLWVRGTNMGGQVSGYYAQVRVATGEIFIKRNGTIVASHTPATLAPVALPFKLGLQVVGGDVTVSLNGAAKLLWSDTASASITGTYCGIGTGAGAGDCFFEYFLAQELGKAIEWKEVGGADAQGSLSGTPSDAVPLELKKTTFGPGTLRGTSRADHTHPATVDGVPIFTTAGGTITGSVSIEKNLTVFGTSTLKGLVEAGPIDGVNAGGTVRLRGAATNASWDVTNNAGLLRFVRVSDGAEIFQLTPGTGPTDGVVVRGTKLFLRRADGTDWAILDPAAPHARTGDPGWGQVTFQSETLSGDALIDGTVTSNKLSATALRVGTIPTGTANSGRGRFLRYVASTLATAESQVLDKANQNIDGLRIVVANASRVLDGAAYGGFAIKANAGLANDAIVLDGPYYGSDAGDYPGSPGLVPGQYKATVYLKADAVGVAGANGLYPEAMRLQAIAYPGGVETVVKSATYFSDQIGTAYVGLSTVFTLTADTRSTTGFRLVVRNLAASPQNLTVSHVRVESYEGMDQGEVATFIRHGEIISAQIFDLSATKLVAGVIGTDNIEMGAAGLIWFGASKTAGSRLELKGGGTDPARGLFAYSGGTQTIRLSADGVFQLRGVGTNYLNLQSDRLELWRGTARTVFLDGATGNAVFEGQVSALSGSIGGFRIEGSYLQASGGTSLEVGVSGNSNLSAFWAGGPSGSAPFRVTAAGALHATGANVSGTINASGGNFSGEITGGTFTGGTFRTKASGQRTELQGGLHDIKFYSGLAEDAPGNIDAYGDTNLNSNSVRHLRLASGRVGGKAAASIELHSQSHTGGEAAYISMVAPGGLLVGSATQLHTVLHSNNHSHGSVPGASGSVTTLSPTGGATVGSSGTYSDGAHAHKLPIRRGNFLGTTDANGVVTIAHSIGATPGGVGLTMGVSAATANFQAKLRGATPYDATNLYVQIIKADGTNATGTEVRIYWVAMD